MLNDFFSGRGRFIAGTIFLFLATQEVSGLSALRGLAEVLLVAIALREIYFGIPGWRKLVVNPVYTTAVLFGVSALLSCAISPLPELSFGELNTPVLKGMLLLPLVLSVSVLGLARCEWSEERIARLLIFALAISGLGQLVWVIFSYFNYFLKFDRFPDDPYFHRYKVGAVLIVFPFVLLAIRDSTRSWALLMGFTVIGLLAVILTSNSRGAWLGLLLSVGYLYLVNRKSRFLAFRLDIRFFLVSFLGIGVVLFLLAGTPMIDQLYKQAAMGFDTSNRFGQGVWGATFDMILQKPWLGYGYGDGVYAISYNAMAPSHPEWIVRKSIGAHNAILAHWVAAGIYGLIAICLLYAGFLVGVKNLIHVNKNNLAVVNLLRASVAALASYYLVRGQFEIVRWNSYGILIGVVLWLFAFKSSQRRLLERE